MSVRRSILILLSALVAISYCSASGSDRLPATANAAKAKFDEASRKARLAYEQAMVAAKKEYLKGLEVALKQSMKDGKLDDANAIATVRNQLEASIKVAQSSQTGRSKVDLLSLIDLRRDTVEGVWQMRNGVLSVNGATNARLRIPYEPPADYDFTVECVRLKGHDAVAQIFTVGPSQVALSMGSWGKDVSLESDQKSDLVFSDSAVTANGPAITSTIQVRGPNVRILLNGKLIAERKMADDQRPSKAWAIPSTSQLGIGSWYGVSTEFRRVEVIEVSGPGKVLSDPGDANR